MSFAISKCNNITLIAVQKPFNSEIFDVSVSYKVGSVNETRDLAGISHALEHCVFLGSKNLKTRTAIEKKLLSYGGDYNAFTGQESTGYALSGHLKDMEDSIHTLYDISSNPLLKAGKSFDKEKQVILSELAQDLDDDGNWQVSEVVALEHLFKGTKAEWGPIGYLDSVTNLTAEDLKNYHSTHYKTGQSCIVAVTSLPPEETIRRISKVAEDYAEQAANNITYKVDYEDISNVRAVLPVKAASSSLELGFMLPYPEHKFGNGGVQLLVDLLFHSEFSLLFGEARKKGLAYFVGGTSQDILGRDVFNLNTIINEKNISKFCNTLTDQLDKVFQGDIKPSFFETIKKFRLYRCERLKENYQSYSDILENREFLGRNYSLPEDLIDQVKNISIDQIAELSAIIFKSTKAVVTIKGSHSDKTKDVLCEVMQRLL